MRSYNKLFFGTIILIAIVFVICNTGVLSMQQRENDRKYRVEANRVAAEIQENGFDGLDLSGYHYVTEVSFLQEGEESFFDAESDYVIRQIDGMIYRIDYHSDGQKNYEPLIKMNTGLGIMAMLLIGVMLLLRQKIVKPFEEFREIPYELAKGNLTIPVKESKSRYFGTFLWGVDLLREHLEQQKQHELDLQKEKKTLVLSVSHDIKTPLSAIKLYAKTLSKGLYSDKSKHIEIAERIDAKADEIEGYISEIIRASSEDFMNLEVTVGEFYLSEIVQQLEQYYTEKLGLVKTEFRIGEYSDCLLKGDKDRFTEVLQNIMENAIKYGDGHKIMMSFAKEEDCRLVTVINSGCTLQDVELPHIFDSFWRGSNAEHQKGSGLGLYICRKLMRNMDGDVFAEIANGNMQVTVLIREV